MTDIAYACLAYHIPEDSAILRLVCITDMLSLLFSTTNQLVDYGAFSYEAVPSVEVEFFASLLV